MTFPGYRSLSLVDYQNAPCYKNHIRFYVNKFEIEFI